MNTSIKQTLQLISENYGSENSVILDWYDGPLAIRNTINGLPYYYFIHDMKGWKYIVFTPPKGFDTNNAHEWGFDNALSFLCNFHKLNDSSVEFYLCDTDDDAGSRPMDAKEIESEFSDNRRTIAEQLLFEVMRYGNGTFQTSGKKAVKSPLGLSGREFDTHSWSAEDLDKLEQELKIHDSLLTKQGAASVAFVTEEDSDCIYNYELELVGCDAQDLDSFWLKIEVVTLSKAELLDSLPEELIDALKWSFNSSWSQIPWLFANNRAFEGKSPLAAIKETCGLEHVIQHLARVAKGELER